MKKFLILPFALLTLFFIACAGENSNDYSGTWTAVYTESLSSTARVAYIPSSYEVVISQSGSNLSGTLTYGSETFTFTGIVASNAFTISATSTLSNTITLSGTFTSSSSASGTYSYNSDDSYGTFELTLN